MLSFESDYIAGAHPAVLARLVETNAEPLPGYGADHYSAAARDKIRAACTCPAADVHFVAGGTQTNALVISSLLREFEGVVAAETGHVSQHEAGAIEYTGHKVLTLPQENGKLSPADLRAYVETFYADGNREHMVYPGMVYLSHPTEYGTLYTKAELTEIADLCHTYGMPLYLDGARLGFALASEESDLSLPDIAALCDVFYIGGTKIGALCGEAVVFTKGNTPAHFMNLTKKKGALLAKGRLTGVQFDALFTDDLYMQISRHAIRMANKLRDLFCEKGYRFFIPSPTNQQFVILENEKMKALQKEVAFSFWERFDGGHTVVRFATGWSTTEEDLIALSALL